MKNLLLFTLLMMSTLICSAVGPSAINSNYNPDPLPSDTTSVIPLHEIMPNIRVANAVIYWFEREHEKQKQIISHQHAAHQTTIMAIGECRQQKSMLGETNAMQNVQIVNQAGIISQQSTVIYILGTIAAISLGYGVYQTVTK